MLLRYFFVKAYHEPMVVLEEKSSNHQNQFNHWGPWMFAQNIMVIHIDIFQSGPKWQTNQLITTANILLTNNR